MKLLIDYREKNIINLLKNNNSINNNIEISNQEKIDNKIKSDEIESNDIDDKYNHKDKFVSKWNNIELNIEISNLPVADFIFADDSKYSILVERKTHSDLESSIVDGRFRQQKSRLIESISDPNMILYIIEGSKQIKKPNIVNGSIINMLYKHNFKVLFSKNHEDTLTLLSLIYKKLLNGDIQICNSTNNNDILEDKNESDINTQVSPFKLISKSDSIKKQLFQCILTVIPGVSINISNKIVELYPTLKSLIDAYENLDDDKSKEKLLADINVGNRKLGPAISKKVWKTIYFNSID